MRDLRQRVKELEQGLGTEDILYCEIAGSKIRLRSTPPKAHECEYTRSCLGPDGIARIRASVRVEEVSPCPGCGGQ